MESIRGSNDAPRAKTSTPTEYSLSSAARPSRLRSTTKRKNRRRLSADRNAELSNIFSSSDRTASTEMSGEWRPLASGLFFSGESRSPSLLALGNDCSHSSESVYQKAAARQKPVLCTLLNRRGFHRE